MNKILCQRNLNRPEDDKNKYSFWYTNGEYHKFEDFSRINNTYLPLRFK